MILTELLTYILNKKKTGVHGDKLRSFLGGSFVMIRDPFYCIILLALGKGLEPLYPESKSGALTVVLTEH